MQPPTIRLPHCGLTVPHTGYTVTALKQHNTHDGVAFTATLRRDKQIIGTIENSGTGGPDTFYPSTADGYRTEIPALQAYASHCTDERGQTPDVELLLSYLVTEYETARDVKRATKRANVLLRLREDLEVSHGEPMGWATTAAVTEAHHTLAADPAKLAEMLDTDTMRAHELAWWQMWNAETATWVDVTTRPAHLATETAA